MRTGHFAHYATFEWTLAYERLRIVFSKISVICDPLSGSLLDDFFLKISVIFSSDFVTSASCVPDAKQIPKGENNSRHASRRTQKSIDLNMHVWRNIRHVRVISVSVIIAIV